MITAEHIYRHSDPDVSGAFACRRWLEEQQREARLRDGLDDNVPVWSEPQETSDTTVVAYANHGRWVVDCPNPACWSAQIASADDKRFFCVECGNAHVGGAYVKVKWPTAKKRAEIEQALELRPNPINRNWWPHEPVSALRAQNAEFIVEDL